MNEPLELRIIHGSDRLPMQLVTGEQLQYWLDLERLSRQIVSQKYETTLYGLLGEMAHLLGFSTQE